MSETGLGPADFKICCYRKNDAKRDLLLRSSRRYVSGW